MQRNSFFYALLLLSMMVLAPLTMQAGPAKPGIIPYRQPDGQVINITLHGDEFVHWAESDDGYTLLRNAEGFYEYACKDAKGELVLSGTVARNLQQRTATDNTVLQTISKKLRFSEQQMAVFQQARQMREQALSRRPTHARTQSNALQHAPAVTGTLRVPVILMQFAEKPFTRTANEFQLLFNQLNYTATADRAITGSVRDYFLASSYGQCDIQFDIYGPYTMAHTLHEYYYGDFDIFTEAALAADNDGDFSQYDANNDGEIDAIHFIFPGYAAENGAPPPAAHSAAECFSLSPDFALILDGKTAYSFSFTSELRYSGAATDPIQYKNKITSIGAICHELGHSLFYLPDLYDEDEEGSGGKSVDLGGWDIMAGGGVHEDTPPLHSAWCRDYLGWVPAVEISTPQSITFPNPAMQGASYKITTATPNEYFLVENRQKTGWDVNIPASGMLIYHVDENTGKHVSHWVWSGVNINPAHRGLYVKQAGGGAGSTNGYRLSSNGIFRRETDPYPQPSNNQFSDYSVPNSLSWAGVNTNKPITNITQNVSDRTVSFDFMQVNAIDDKIITLSSNPNYMVLSGGGIFANGSQCTVEVKNEENWSYNQRFTGWTENGVVVSTDSIYTFTVTDNRNLVAAFTQPIGSNDATLARIIVNDHILTPNQDQAPSAVYGVGTSVDYFITSAAISAITNHPNATVSGTGVKSLNNIGKYDFYLTVTAEDMVTRQTYWLSVNRQECGTYSWYTDPRLAKLTVNQGTLSPNFSSCQLEYNVTVTSPTISISATANTPDCATVSGTGTKTLNLGLNTFNIKTNGTCASAPISATYTINVTRLVSSDAKLKTLSINGATLSPSFNANTLNYTANVTNMVSSVTISATTNHAGATLTGTGSKLLAVGQNTFEITVTAEDGTTQQTYTVAITRAPIVSVTGVSLNKPGTSLKIEATEQLTATVLPADATNKAVTWSSNNTAIATVSTSGLVKAVSVGSATITATTQDGSFTANCAVTIEKRTQIITFNLLPAQTYGDAPFTLSGTSNSGLQVSYASSDDNVASVSGSMVTITGAGTSEITASQPGNDSYNAAAPVSRTFTVNQAPLAITANNATRKQGLPNPEFTLSYSGFKNMENESVLAVLPAIACEAGETSPIGFYDIVLSGGSDDNYAYSLINGKLEVTQASSIDEVSTDIIRIYPNPVKDYLYVRSDAKVERVTIIASTGEAYLNTFSISDAIDVSALPQGIYMVRIFTDNTVVTKKIFKTNREK